MEIQQLTAEQIASDAVAVEKIPPIVDAPQMDGRIQITVDSYDPMTGKRAESTTTVVAIQSIRQRIKDLQASRDITDGLIATEIEKLNQIGETP